MQQAVRSSWCVVAAVATAVAAWAGVVTGAALVAATGAEVMVSMAVISAAASAVSTIVIVGGTHAITNGCAIDEPRLRPFGGAANRGTHRSMRSYSHWRSSMPNSSTLSLIASVATLLMSVVPGTAQAGPQSIFKKSTEPSSIEKGAMAKSW